MSAAVSQKMVDNVVGVVAVGMHLCHLDYSVVDQSPAGCCRIQAARLGAKEIGHNLARERPKFGHNLVRKRHKIGHSLERE